MKDDLGTVRILAAPIGEAPLWVREAWIGLDLPLAWPEEMTTRIVGVLSGPRTRLGLWWAILIGRAPEIRGYLVWSGTAIDRLAKTRPEAADWWRVNAGEFTQPEATFVFDTPACGTVTAPSAANDRTPLS